MTERDFQARRRPEKHVPRFHLQHPRITDVVLTANARWVLSQLEREAAREVLDGILVTSGKIGCIRQSAYPVTEANVHQRENVERQNSYEETTQEVFIVHFFIPLPRACCQSCSLRFVQPSTSFHLEEQQT